MTEEQILQALRDCYAPLIPLNVVALGLVEHIALTPDRDAPGAGIAGVPERFAVCVTLLSASDDEAAQAQLIALVRNRLAGLPQLSRISVELVTAPAWTPARITPEGRRTLGLDHLQFPILNNRMR